VAGGKEGPAGDKHDVLSKEGKKEGRKEGYHIDTSTISVVEMDACMHKIFILKYPHENGTTKVL